MFLSKVFKSESVATLSGIHFIEFQSNEALGGVISNGDDFRQETLVCPLHKPAESSVGMQDFDRTENEIRQREEEAYARGLQDGLAAVETGLNQTVDAFTEALEDISVLRKSLLENATADMTNLVMAIARKVIRVELSINQDVVLETIQAALQAAINADEFRIKVNPQDFSLVTERKPQMLASVSGLKNVIIESDPHVGRGGALLESELGEVDATIESQLLDIEKHLLGWSQED